jgi:hypothetical protein
MNEFQELIDAARAALNYVGTPVRRYPRLEAAIAAAEKALAGEQVFQVSDEPQPIIGRIPHGPHLVLLARRFYAIRPVPEPQPEPEKAEPVARPKALLLADGKYCCPLCGAGTGATPAWCPWCRAHLDADSPIRLKPVPRDPSPASVRPWHWVSATGCHHVVLCPGCRFEHTSDKFFEWRAVAAGDVRCCPSSILSVEGTLPWEWWRTEDKR